jgi:predicted transcriptional regulator
VRKALDDQITRQKSEIEVLGDKLRTKIKEAVQEKIRSELYEIVEASVAEKVEEKVRDQVRCFESRTYLYILIYPSL